MAEELQRDLKGSEPRPNIYFKDPAFKATFGKPPYQYTLIKRIEQAQKMLATSLTPIADIALACGFNGASQFARSFRGLTGQTLWHSVAMPDRKALSWLKC